MLVVHALHAQTSDNLFKSYSMKLYLLIDHWGDGDLSLIVTVAFLSKLSFLLNPAVLSRKKSSSQNNPVFYAINLDYVFKKAIKSTST